MNALIHFEDIIIDFSGSIIFLDIDGTLVEDGGIDFQESVISKVNELKRKNRIYFCTNMNDKERKNIVEQLFSVPSTDPNFKKPNKKVLRGIARNNEELVVIGDKTLMDGVLAKRIGARFIKVKRKLSNNDPFSTKLFYILDDIASEFIKI